MNKVEVLFVCVHNSGRSQMAEGWFNHLAHKRRIDLRAASAGTMPGNQVNPRCVEAMSEVGVDISQQHPRLIHDDMIASAERVISMGCNIDSGICPSLTYALTEDWELNDPSLMALDEIRALRLDIRNRVENLLTQMTQPVSSAG